MELHEIELKKTALENELSVKIQEAFSKFKTATGVGILAIDVNVYRCHALSEPVPDPVVGTVSLHLDL